jgi:long-subunit acyl-CoA synthetase (AMP-forming)
MSDLASALLHYGDSDGTQIAVSDADSRLTRAEQIAWVAGAAEDLGPAPETIGILGPNGVEWAVAFLAASIAGKTIVPVPAFFSKAQRAHLIRDAGIERLLVTSQRVDDSDASIASHVLTSRRTSLRPAQIRDGGLIIYTSGSTGTPKGVRLVSGQALWSAHALASVIGASANDKYLSLLPLPMLLEIICGIMIPSLVGGAVYYERAVAESVGSGHASDVLGAFERTKPTTSVMVPQLLALYVAQLLAAGKRPPESLRFVAIGGAPLPPAIAVAAQRLRIPAYEGYGLSECASVVAVNCPEASRAGSVGRPIPGLLIDIEDGGIVVQGPSVMDGYLGAAPSTPHRWQTGDMGRLDPDGFLWVLGRRDNLIVTPYGRNVSPEWIETMLGGDPRIEASVVCQGGDPLQLSALLVPSRNSEPWMQAASQDSLNDLVAHACRNAPEYARPKSVIVISRASAVERGLFTANGRVRRAGAAQFLQDRTLNQSQQVAHDSV